MLPLRKEKLLICSFYLLLCNNSFAGAWLQLKDESEIIFETEQKDLFTYYKDPYSSGNINTNIYSFVHYSIFSRYGITNDINIGVEAKFYDYKSNFNNDSLIEDNSILLKNTERIDPYTKELSLYLDSHYKKYENKLSEYKIFSQFKMWDNDSSIISIKTNIGGFFSDKINMAGVGLLYGKSFNFISKHAYFDMELGADNIYDSPIVDSKSIDSLKIMLDFTLGVDFLDKQSFILQSFNHTDPVQPLKNSVVIDHKTEFSNILKISWVYKFNKHLFLQSGYSTNITCREKYIANSIITSFGVKF